MKNYVLSWNGSGATSEINAQNDAAAIAEAAELIGGKPIVADQWDGDGLDDDDRPCKRILFWTTEDDAENDSGQNAIAQLSTTGSPT